MGKRLGAAGAGIGPVKKRWGEGAQAKSVRFPKREGWLGGRRKECQKANEKSVFI